MAGTQPPQNPNQGTLKPKNDKWHIQYSRFFSFPRLPSTCPTLRPLPPRWSKKHPCGNWLTSSSMASLHLINDDMAGGIVLIVSYQGKVYEEHHISKLIFSWPQVSCLEACSVRGSRVVFASYGDSEGQVQKFAVRFSSSSNSQVFIDTLKDGLKDVTEVRHTDGRFGSKMTSASEHIPDKELNILNLVGNYGSPVKYISRHESINHAQSEELIPAHSSEATCAPLPSSFTALLFDSCTKWEKEPPKAPETSYLNNQWMGCMTDSSFSDMLRTLEMVIDELGGGLAL